MDNRTAVLGEEFDGDLRDLLKDILRNLGATALRRNSWVAGSQELETMEVMLRGRVLTIEAETYVGLSISGHADDVSEIAGLVAQRRRPPPPG